jgi:nicotinamide-nucleotide adenylyltransferase
LKDREKFSGTNIRNLITEDKNWRDLVPQGTRNVLDSVNAKERLKNL